MRDLSRTGRSARLLVVVLCALTACATFAKLRSWATAPMTGPDPHAVDLVAEMGGKLYVLAESRDADALDVFVLDTSTMVWYDLTASITGVSPPIRHGMGLASLDGRLYVFGGGHPIQGSGIFYDALHSFDPVLVQWESLTEDMQGTPPSPRQRMGIAASDGRMYVFGGDTAGFGPTLHDFFVFDPPTLTWTELTPSGPAPPARHWFGMAFTGGLLYVAGGFTTGGTQINDLYVFNPASMAWTNLTGVASDPFPPQPSCQGLGMVAFQGRLFVTCGGVARFDAIDPSTAAWTDLSASVSGWVPDTPHTVVVKGQLCAVVQGSMHFFDPIRLSWSTTPGSGAQPLPTKQTTMAELDGKLYVFGGAVLDVDHIAHSSDFHVLDPMSMTWTSLSPPAHGTPPSTRSWAGVVGLGGLLYVYGGVKGDDEWLNEVVRCFFSQPCPRYPRHLYDLHVYNPENRSWTDLTASVTGTPPSDSRVLRPVGMAAAGGRIYVVGEGHLHVFDPSEMKWTDLTSAVSGFMPASSQVAALDGRLYVHEGQGMFHTFHPERLTWTALSMSGTAPSEVEHIAASQGQIYAFGYVEGLNEFYVFDPRTLTWAEVPIPDGGMPTPRRQAALAVQDSRLFVFGGSRRDDFDMFNDVWHYRVARQVHLSSFATFKIDLLFVFDTDSIVLDPSGDYSIRETIELCTGAWPCQLQVLGDNASLSLQTGARLSCDRRNGCTQLSLQALHVGCTGAMSGAPVAISAGAHVSITHSTVSGCSSLTSGGFLHLSGGSSAAVSSCSFDRIRSSGSGGAVLSEESALEISESTFRQCAASQHGGALLSTGTLVVARSAFYETSAEGEGGAIATLEGADAVVTGSRFEQCWSRLGGGALTVRGSTSLTSCTFVWCASDGPGGALRASGTNQLLSPVTSSLTAAGSEWKNCTSHLDGGAVSVIDGPLRLFASTFESNAAAGFGGAIHVEGGSLDVEESTLRHNSAVVMGGALSVRHGTMTVASTLLAGNVANGLGGGAMHVLDTTTELDNLVVHNNSAPGGGGGVLLFQGMQQPQIGQWNGGLCGAACRVGTEQTQAGCTVCPPGSYKSTSGTGQCMTCPAGSFADVGASTCSLCPVGSSGEEGSGHCSCSAGFEGPSGGPCSACAVGQYKDWTGPGQCVPCEPGSFKVSAGPGTCTACPTGMYSGPGGVNCSACPPASSAPPGSTSVENCSCDPGFSGPDGGVCVECPAGQYKDWTGSGPCLSCEPGSYKTTAGPGTCTACPPRMYSGPGGVNCSIVSCPTGSSPRGMNVENCSCDPGFSGPDGGVCVECPAGQNKDWTGPGQCVPCEPGSFKVSAGPGTCTACPTGMYSGPGGVNCSACPPASSAPPGSTSVENCSCDPGFFRSEVGHCLPCEAGTFTQSQGSTACLSCLSGTFSPNSSALSCEECFAGSYSLSGASTCTVCPPGAWSEPGSRVCQCMAGYSGSDGGPCVACESGKYKETAGEDKCVSCPANTVGPPASRGKHLCMCNAGFTGSPDGECVACSDASGCNSARFGPCVASEVRVLQVHGPDVSHAGEELEIRVEKKDLYGQRIVTDSSSVLQAGAGSEWVELLGSGVHVMREGEALFSLAVKPTWTRVDAVRGTAQLVEHPQLVFRGTDSQSETAEEMVSSSFTLNLTSGRQACPAGSVLSLDPASAAATDARAGVCLQCGSGSYSLDPLAGPDSDPGCFDCPAGGDCGSGGGDVAFEKGTWSVINGSYFLLSCPRGHGMARTDRDSVFVHQLQQCLPCSKGTECVADECRTCDDCKLGSYKDLAGTHACRSCPAGTFGPSRGATSVNDCRQCPANSGTGGRAGQDSVDDCECLSGFYPVEDDGGVQCVTCPHGAECSGQVIRTRGGLDATGEVEWARGADGRWELRRCPRGFRMERARHDEQECVACGPGAFIVSSDDPRAQCQRCPEGLQCFGGGPPLQTVPVKGMLQLSQLGVCAEMESAQALEAWIRGAVREVIGGGDAAVLVTLPEDGLVTCQALMSVRRTTPQVLVARVEMVAANTSHEELQKFVQSSAFVDELAAAFEARGEDATAPVMELTETMATDEVVGEYRVTGDALRLVGCRAGYLLVNSSLEAQHCKRCEALTYSSWPLDGCTRGERGEAVCENRQCQRCPTQGASCEGLDQFQPLLEGSQWELERGDTAQTWRLQACPRGYVAVRNSSEPALDHCWECPPGTYALQPAVYPHTMAAPVVSVALALCRECESNAECSGGAKVEAQKDHWRGQDRDGAAVIYDCFIGQCKGGEGEDQCAEGRTGPICALCVEGWALASSGTRCEECDADAEAASTSAVVLITIIFLVLWYYAAWKPLLSRNDEEEPADVASAGGGRLAKASRVWDKLLLHLLRSHYLAYLKVFISFWQVATTFRVNIRIAWPEELQWFWSWTAALRLSIFDLPGTGCLMKEYTYTALLLLSTLVTVLVTVLFAIPTVLMLVAGKYKTVRFKRVFNSFCFSSTFWMFLAYPTVCMVVMATFRCQEVEGVWYLSSDFREQCSWTRPQSALFILGVASTIAIPLGVPALMLCALWLWRVPAMAREKQDKAVLQRMVWLHSISAEKSLTSKIAAYMGVLGRGASSKAAVLRERAEQFYQDATQGGDIPLTAQRLLEYCHALGLVRVHESEDTKALFTTFDLDKDGLWSFDEFLNFTVTLEEHENHAGGFESVATITDAFLQDLCLFDWNSVTRENDEDEGAGLERELKRRLKQRYRLQHGESSQRLMADKYASIVRSRGSDSPSSSRFLFSSTGTAAVNSTSREGRRIVSVTNSEAPLLLGGTSPSPQVVQGSEMEFSSDVSDLSNSAATPTRQRRAGRIHRAQSMRVFMDRVWSLRQEQEQQAAMQADGELDQFNARRLVKPCPLGPTASRQERLAWLLKAGRRLHAWGYLDYIIASWGATETGEVEAIDKFGFLFDGYKVEHWYYELIEMGRKLLMTGVMGLFLHSPLNQLAVGLLVTVLLLLHFVHVQPYTNMLINHMHTASLLVQTVTLLYGLIEFQASRTGENETRSLAIVVLILHIMIFAIPPLAVFYEEGGHLRRYLRQCCCPRGKRTVADPISTLSQSGSSRSQRIRRSISEDAPQVQCDMVWQDAGVAAATDSVTTGSRHIPERIAEEEGALEEVTVFHEAEAAGPVAGAVMTLPQPLSVTTGSSPPTSTSEAAFGFRVADGREEGDQRGALPPQTDQEQKEEEQEGAFKPATLLAQPYEIVTQSARA